MRLTYQTKEREHESHSSIYANGEKPRSSKRPGHTSLVHWTNNTPPVAQLRHYQEIANNSPQSQRVAQMQSLIDNSPYMAVQRKRLHSIFEPSTLPVIQEDEQRESFDIPKTNPSGLVQRKSDFTEKTKNNTGLPDHLKSGIENLSGYSLEDVKVHYNSGKPAQLQAHAYAQGTNIHIAPGQEKHLPHEAWHVVQQKQGRVKATAQLKGKVQINDDASLEKEADMMGSKAFTTPSAEIQSSVASETATELEARTPESEVIQGCWNTAFFLDVDYLNHIPQNDETSSLDMAQSSMEHARGIAYIVNAILPYSEISEIPNVVNSILDGLGEDDYGRIAIILGVNAPEEQQQQLEEAVTNAKEVIDALPVAVALVKSTFKGKFPYGEMRNQVLHSPETRLITDYFTSLRFHPYISVQDFDTGSRRVESEKGKHIFHAIDERLMKPSPDDEDLMGLNEDHMNVVDQGGSSGSAMDESSQDHILGEEDLEGYNFDDDEEGGLESLPLMIGGGYRVGSQKALQENTLKRLEKDKNKWAKKPQSVKDKLSSFPDFIQQDMRYRDQYARIAPLLPYAPEPNLFIDATAVKTGSPVTGQKLRFGSGGAEYTELAKLIGKFSAEELEAYYTQKYHTQKEVVVDPKELLSDIANQLLVDAQNNRHPVRGEDIHMDFEKLAIETDLSRLAAGMFKAKTTTPQSHKGLGTVTDRLFSSKRDKSGASLSSVNKRFKTESSGTSPFEFMMNSMEKPEEAEDDLFNPILKSSGPDITKLGKNLSPALSFPFSESGLFKGLYYGLSPNLKKHLIYQVATQQSREEYMREKLQEEEAHEENFRTNAYPLFQQQGVMLRVQQWTRADGDCGIYSLGILLHQNLTRFGLIQQLQQRQEQQPDEQVQIALNNISGSNFNRWLSDDEVIQLGTVLGLHNIAMVQFNSGNNVWVTLQSDPATAPMIIGGVPAALNGSVNHWVILQRVQPNSSQLNDDDVDL